jgi:hypothetical protein
MKSLGIENMNQAKAQVSDIKVFGDPGAWVLLCKASSQEQGWMKSTKIMNIPGGCLVQVSTQQRNPDGSYAVAEALVHLDSVRMNTKTHELYEVFRDGWE